jgi:hypothetical protein
LEEEQVSTTKNERYGPRGNINLAIMTAIDETHHLDSPDLKHSLWSSLIYQEGIVWMLENILEIAA